MAYMQMAMTDFRVKAFIGKLELGLQEFITQNNLDKPALVRNLFTSDPTAADSDSLASAAGAKEDEVDTWAQQLEELYLVSCEQGGRARAQEPRWPKLWKRRAPNQSLRRCSTVLQERRPCAPRRHAPPANLGVRAWRTSKRR